MEIERKFLVNEIPQNLDSYKKFEIEQGYISTKPTIRIRKINKKYVLTVKSKFAVCKSDGDPIINNELECEITEKEYEALKERINGDLIQKFRYIIPLEQELEAELDVFQGRLLGLVFAEVEFTSVEEANNFNKPTWFGRDVSDDRRYRNSEIAKLERYSEEYFKDKT